MTHEMSRRCSPRFRGFPVATLAGLLFAGCFSGADVRTIYCVTNDNCPAGYICADSSKPGGCKKKADVTLDGGALDTAASNDGTSSPDGAGGRDTVTLLDSGVMDGGPGSVDTRLAVDGPTTDAPADIPQLLPDSSDSHVADAPADSPPSETILDGLPPDAALTDAFDAPLGSLGGAGGAGGAGGTGGFSGSGGSPDASAGPTSCTIASIAYPSGFINSSNACLSCQPTTSTTAWSLLPDGRNCGTAQVCHSGICQNIVAECAGKKPGDSVCNGQNVETCGADLVSATVTQTCTNQTCVNGACQGVCGPLQTQCAVDTDGTQSCDTNGQWGTAVACTSGPCVIGVCQSPVTLASSQITPNCIAVYDSYVYWTNNGSSNGSVMKVPVGGGTPTPLATGQSTSKGAANCIAVNGTGVYWATADPIMSVPLAGGTPNPVLSGQGSPNGITIDATSVYCTNRVGGTVESVALGGGMPTSLASGQSYPGSIAVDATNVYWLTSSTTAMVMEVPLGGGTPVPIATGQNNPSGLAVDATSAYWTNNGDGTVMKVALSGGSPTTLATQPGNPNDLTIDATSVYWAINGSGGTIMKVPLGGGTATTLASGLGTIGHIALDSTSIYWTSTGSGEVMKLRVK
jgi:hypothetical protein